ncbi:SAM-dependent methyltransferase [Paractinoplanes globisporus]|uniref:SAM-dependent methyltransferase n=1 Tax=Paractinoplanes globisporus TaxID=113565 RepID=A0ABW6WF19_9ACTN|nr:SAM-dependent methyltransferase [Actinoplanes globisporus]
MNASDEAGSLQRVLEEILLRDWHRPILQLLADGPKRYVEIKAELLRRYDSPPGEGQINSTLRQLRDLGVAAKQDGVRGQWSATTLGEEAVSELDYLDHLMASDPAPRTAEYLSPEDYAAGAARFNPSVPHPARRYNYWLGGKDNFAADRTSADEFERLFPGMRAGVRANRDLLGRGVSFLAADLGIRQFLDIGTGLPTADNTHEIAQRTSADARVVYVDNDPIVLSHARALLRGSPEGETQYIEADLRDPGSIVHSTVVRDTLDFSQPIALLLVGVLHFIRGQGAAKPIVRRLVDALPPGSGLFVTHVTNDFQPPEVVAQHEHMQRQGRSDFWMRSKDEVTDLFAGLEIVPPGIVPVTEWRPTPDTPSLDLRVVNAWAGIGLKRT